MDYIWYVLFGFLWYQVIAIFGISVGLHRYFSHKQFQGSKTFEIVCLTLATIAGARSPLVWVGAHRIHHVYSDTDKDPHSPDYLGFWRVFLNLWNVDNIWSFAHRKYIKDLIDNPRIMFFHRNWKIVYFLLSAITIMISIELFVTVMLIPLIISFFAYGLFNAGGHKNGGPITNIWINILSAGEGFHDIHHNNPGQARLHKYDISGFIIERFLNEKETRSPKLS